MNPRIRILTTGGTIVSTASVSGGGKTPTHSGEELISAVPKLSEYATIEVDNLCQRSGFQMGFGEVNLVLDAVERACADGCDGIVITHGTDTMAETAFAISLVHDSNVPIVCTGAQRAFDEPGTDGPTNLIGAIQTVTDDRFQAAGGVYIVFNDRILDSLWSVKTHSSNLDTFRSPDTGDMAELNGDTVELKAELNPIDAPFIGQRFEPPITIPIITNAIGMNGEYISSITDNDLDGIIVAGTGLGNTTDALGEMVHDACNNSIPVVLTSRCHRGATNGVYGGPGGAKTLLDSGAISGRYLPAWKARIVLAFAATTEMGSEDIDAIIHSLYPAEPTKH